MKSIFKFLFNRIVFIGAALALQLITFIVMVLKFKNQFVYFYSASSILSIIVVIFILNSRSKPVYKIAWIIPILLFPIFGGLFYLMFGRGHLSQKAIRKMKIVDLKMAEALEANDHILTEIEAEDVTAANQSRYLSRFANCPPYKNSSTEYLPTGEAKFAKLLEELKKAKHYIFLEYFIIEEGIMWNSILDILVEKAQAGVDVRVIYDDVGCMTKLPFRYDKKLEALGIKCAIFNPFLPILSFTFNNRDHRKIVVIDGHTGFVGGINLADEYINAKERFGHWKDTALMIKGDAVWSLTVMFLSMWDYLKGIEEDYEEFKSDRYLEEKIESDGYVQPYSDNPLDYEPVSETVYLNLINKAKEYVYINTPYLIIDSEMVSAICSAAKQGIDIRIITPHKPDKWYVHAVTRTHYEVMLEAGVKIYEYTPGFMHAKTFVVDDKYAVVGTINLDYRSLYLHYECGVWLFNTKSVAHVKQDFLDTLAVSHAIKLADMQNIKWYKKLLATILRTFAPLM